MTAPVLHPRRAQVRHSCAREGQRGSSFARPAGRHSSVVRLIAAARAHPSLSAVAFLPTAAPARSGDETRLVPTAPFALLVPAGRARLQAALNGGEA